MPKIFPLSRTTLIRKLKRLGYQGPFSGGRHQYMLFGNHKIFIPNPHKKDVLPFILKNISNELGLSAEEFNNL